MTTYKGIKGFSIQTVAGDPSNNIAGQMWYNSSARKIRIGKTTAASWSTGGNLNQARVGLGAFGSQTANAVFGGFNPPAIKLAVVVPIPAATPVLPAFTFACSVHEVPS